MPRPASLCVPGRKYMISTPRIYTQRYIIFAKLTTSHRVINGASGPKGVLHTRFAAFNWGMDQDGVVSPLSRNVQAPVNICFINDSLHWVCDGAGRPCWSCHIVAIDKTAINANNIHIVRLIILVLLYVGDLPVCYMVRKIIFINACFCYNVGRYRMTS